MRARPKVDDEVAVPIQDLNGIVDARVRVRRTDSPTGTVEQRLAYRALLGDQVHVKVVSTLTATHSYDRIPAGDSKSGDGLQWTHPGHGGPNASTSWERAAATLEETAAPITVGKLTVKVEVAAAAPFSAVRSGHVDLHV